MVPKGVCVVMLHFAFCILHFASTLCVVCCMLHVVHIFNIARNETKKVAFFKKGYDTHGATCQRDISFLTCHAETSCRSFIASPTPSLPPPVIKNRFYLGV